MQRILSLDIFDYAEHNLCSLYDSTNDMDGQAHDVIVHTERNGFKELRFNLPSECEQERNYRLDFLVSDYRIRFREVKNGETEIDWFLISESKVAHSNFSTDYEIRAGHISQLLNTKNLSLEFSEDEGNNVGTIGQIAAVILEGTGWHLGIVHRFMEEEKFNRGTEVEKSRTFNASAKTGAFKMINDLCELFDAKPIYHGQGQYTGYNVVGTDPNDVPESVFREELDSYEADKAVQEAINEGWTNVAKVELEDMLTGRTVDIIPMNPFSEKLDDGYIPTEVTEKKVGVLELHYDKNLSNVTRTLNSENIVTKLYAYGSFGDRNGSCSLLTAEHEELTFVEPITANTEYYFEWKGGLYYFTPTNNYQENTLTWSTLDFTSRSYIDSGIKKDGLPIVYKVYRTRQGEGVPSQLTHTSEYKQNWISALMDFTYYQSVNLLDDEMLRELAKYQIEIPTKTREANEASIALSERKADLFNVASDGGGFASLSISTSTLHNGYAILNLDPSYPLGVKYRSDYAENQRNYFSWRTALSIKDNGEAISAKGSIIYVVDQTVSPTSWKKIYVRAIGNADGFYFEDVVGNTYIRPDELTVDRYSELDYVVHNEEYLYFVVENQYCYIWNGTEFVKVTAADYIFELKKFPQPTRLKLWTSEDINIYNKQIFLFSSDSIAGLFGPREDQANKNIDAIEKETSVSTERHPLYFRYEDPQGLPPDIVTNGYGWYYRSYLNERMYDFGDLYFCWGSTGDISWTKVNVYNGDGNPENDTVHTDIAHYKYLYHTKRMMLYRNEESKWVPMDDKVDDKNMKSYFAIVINGCIDQERIIKGVAETYTYEFNDEWFADEALYIEHMKKISRDYRWAEENNRTDLMELYVAEWRTSYEEMMAEQHKFTVLPTGNYAFKNEYGIYYLFSTDQDVDPTKGGRVIYVSDDNKVKLDDTADYTVSAVESKPSLLNFPVSNEIDGITFQNGKLKEAEFDPNGDKRVSNNITDIHPNTLYEYEAPIRQGARVELTIVCFDVNNRIRKTVVGTIGEFATDAYTTHIRIMCANELGDNGESIDLHVKNYDSVFFKKDKMYTILPSVASETHKGLPYLMDCFITLATDIYTVHVPTLLAAQEVINQANIHLMNKLGDMYREGYIQNNDYVEDDEDKLYKDTLDDLKEISHPEATYEITYLDLYEADNLVEDEDKSTDKVRFPDIDITFAAHLVDTEIDTNKWAYIDTIDKCYDQPWKTTIEINTKLSMIGQQSFTDVLTKIAETANEVRANQAIYKKADAITNSGKFAAARLEGAIEANKVYLMGGTSNWYTDNKGNMIFEDADGQSALMLTGRGLCVAVDKNEYGEWAWRTAITGEGLSADMLYTGYLSGTRIEAGTITADKLVSSVGQELEIGSNKALSLYATIDGNRPVDGFETKHPNEGDSWIRISAKDGNIPAFIAIKSGGNVDLEAGGKMNITGSEVNIVAESYSVDSWTQWVANAQYDVGAKVKHQIDNVWHGFICTESNHDNKFNPEKWEEYHAGKINIHSGGSINIDSSGDFIVDSPNFKVLKVLKDSGTEYEYNVIVDGNITANSGCIAGLTIGEREDLVTHEIIRFMKTGNSMLGPTSEAAGMYIGTDGLNVAGKLMFTTDGNTAKLKVSADNIILGNTDQDNLTKAIGDAVETAEGYTDDLIPSAARHYECPANGNTGILTKDYRRNDLWTDSATGDDYICIKNADSIADNRKLTDWMIYGTSIKGASFELDAKNGTIGLKAETNISVLSGGSIKIAANNEVAITTNGTIKLGKANNYFTIGSHAITIESQTQEYAYIQSGSRLSYDDTSSNGVYLGTDGISLGREFKGHDENNNPIYSIPFSVSKDGHLIATGAEIYGDIYAENGHIAGWNIDADKLYKDDPNDASSYVALSSDGIYRIWAGNATAANAPFSVKKDGSLYTIKGQLANWYIYDNYICSHVSDVDQAQTGISTNIYVDSTARELQPEYVIWAGNYNQGTHLLPDWNRANSNFYVRSDGSIKAGTFTVDNAGNVTCSNLAMTGGSINGEDIEITAKSVRITSTSGGYISLGDISTTITNGVPKVNATGITIDGNSITATSTADINFSSANSISFKSGAISLSSISGGANILTKDQSITMNADKSISLSGNGGISLSGGSISMTGGSISITNESYIKINDWFLGSYKDRAGVKQSGLFCWSSPNPDDMTFYKDTFEGLVCISMYRRAYYDDSGVVMHIAHAKHKGDDDYDSAIIFSKTNGNHAGMIGTNGRRVKEGHFVDLYKSGASVSTSSIGTKKNIKSLPDQGEIIDQFNPVSFEYKESPGYIRYGLIAEEAGKVMPVLCDITKDGITYDDLIPVLIKEVQSLRKRIKELESR